MKTEAAECAKAIRTELKSIWPRVKFTVKSRNFAGGNAVDISWEFGPTSKQVEKITDKYQHGSFDGMTDCYNYSKTTTAHSAKYVHTHRHTPEAVHLQMCRDYAVLLGDPIPEGQPAYNHRPKNHGEWVGTLVNRLESCFDLPLGYQGITHAKDEHGNEKLGAGHLEDFYELVGGIRIDRWA